MSNFVRGAKVRSTKPAQQTEAKPAPRPEASRDHAAEAIARSNKPWARRYLRQRRED